MKNTEIKEGRPDQQDLGSESKIEPADLIKKTENITVKTPEEIRLRTEKKTMKREREALQKTREDLSRLKREERVWQQREADVAGAIMLGHREIQPKKEVVGAAKEKNFWGKILSMFKPK